MDIVVSLVQIIGSLLLFKVINKFTVDINIQIYIVKKYL